MRPYCTSELHKMANSGSAAAKHRAENVARMNSLEGFDVVIVCTGSSEQASYWQARLEAGLGAVLPFNTTVLAVTEDWPGGAGNALGTLFAWQNAADLAKSRYNLDLASGLASVKISVGMFHTAGECAPSFWLSHPALSLNWWIRFAGMFSPHRQRDSTGAAARQ